jgi:hypothetical protein
MVEKALRGNALPCKRFAAVLQIAEHSILPRMDTNTCERLLTFSQLAKLPWLPRRNGKKIHVVTFWRWSMRGISGVRLPVSYVGQSPCCTESDLRNFFRAVAEKKQGGGAPPTIPTPLQRQREIAAAGATLDEDGIK